MVRKVFWLLCLILLASMAAVADDVPSGGSGSSGVVSQGQTSYYDLDGAVFEPDWGIPGVGNALAGGGSTLDQHTMTFDRAAGIAVDPLNLGATCNGGSLGGTASCASPFSQAWNVTTLTTDSIAFTALPGGELLMDGDTFSANIFFAGADTNGASLSSDLGLTAIPEPSNIILFGSALLGLAGVFRRKLLL